VIQTSAAPQAVAQIIQAEQAGVPAIWATSGGIGGADLLPTWAAAAVKTERIVLGTAIVRTWPRHSVALAEEALAIEQLAPGRFRLGIGPTGETQAVQTYGANYRKPLTQVREYLTVLRALLYDGAVDFVGEHVTARSSLRTPVRIPLLASAAGLRAFELCGELSGGNGSRMAWGKCWHTRCSIRPTARARWRAPLPPSPAPPARLPEAADPGATPLIRPNSREASWQATCRLRGEHEKGPSL
jgi:hypothetical protein